MFRPNKLLIMVIASCQPLLLHTGAQLWDAMQHTNAPGFVHKYANWSLMGFLINKLTSLYDMCPASIQVAQPLRPKIEFLWIALYLFPVNNLRKFPRIWFSLALTARLVSSKAYEDVYYRPRSIPMGVFPSLINIARFAHLYTEVEQKCGNRNHFYSKTQL